MNIVLLQGRLTRDVESRTVGDGITVCRFTVAVDGYKDKDGNKQTDFIECTAWRQTADFLARFFGKGQEIIIEGNLKNNNFEKDGVKHYSYVVNVNKAYFCGSKSDNQQSGGTYQTANQQNSAPAKVQTAPAANKPDLDLEGFEEIINDGDDVPF